MLIPIRTGIAIANRLRIKGVTTFLDVDAKIKSKLERSLCPTAPTLREV